MYFRSRRPAGNAVPAAPAAPPFLVILRRCIVSENYDKITNRRISKKFAFIRVHSWLKLIG